MKEDFWTFLCCTLSTVIFGTQLGIAGGIFFSLLFLFIGYMWQHYRREMMKYYFLYYIL